MKAHAPQSLMKATDLARGPDAMFFDPRIPWELAVQVADPQAVLAAYGYTGRGAFDLVAHPVFQRELRRHIDGLTTGLTFRKRCEIIADDLLSHAYALASSNETSDAVRAEMIKWVAKMADLEPKDKNATNNAFVLQINMGNGS